MAVRFTIATASIITMSIFIPMMAETPGITLTASMPDVGTTCELYAARVARDHLYSLPEGGTRVLISIACSQKPLKPGNGT